MTRPRIAVVGSGISGLMAAHVLQREADVVLFEASDRLGGHTDTHDVIDSRGDAQAVDCGFIVHNRRTYPTLLRLFAELGVATQESEMSMSVVCEGCGLEYAGARGVKGLVAQPRSLVKPRYLKMLVEVLRFHRQARALLASTTTDDRTLGEFLDAGGFSAYFRAHFMTPVVSAVWSTAPGEAETYPARYLFSFMAHHGMLAVTGSPTWRTVTGGSRSYLQALVKGLPDVRTDAPVNSVQRTDEGVLVDGERYDAIVIATHPHQALAMLAEPTDAEREVLGAITYTANPTVLHHDTSVLPDAPGAAASWNYRTSGCGRDSGTVLVSYDMNRLQRLESPDRWIVTLNATGHVSDDQVVHRMDYEHPLYTPTSVAAQARLPELSDDRIAFAGAYHGWGFHEDGARSGVAAAAALGVHW